MASLNFDDVSRGTDNKKTKRTPFSPNSTILFTKNVFFSGHFFYFMLKKGSFFGIYNILLSVKYTFFCIQAILLPFVPKNSHFFVTFDF